MSADRAAPVRSLILAGGMSRRMGRDKARLSYHGEPQVRHLFGLLDDVAPPVLVSVRDGQCGDPAFRGLPLLPDAPAGAGPMAGLLAAFGRDPQAAWLVVAVDLPRVTRGTLERLLAARDPGVFATAYRIAGEDRPEPVCALYEPRVFPVLHQAAARGRFSLMILQDLPIRLVESAYRGEVAGVNTPAEYRVAVEVR